MLRFFLSLLFVTTASGAADSVDYILSARYVVTMDPQKRVIDKGAVAVRGEQIVAVGSRTDIDKTYKPKHRVDLPEGILTPGLINTHTHAAMSLLRGIADDLKLDEWLRKFIFPLEARFVSPEFVRDGTRVACVEMLLSGTTTFTDMYYFEEVVAEAAKECGIRGVLGQTIIQFPVADARTPADGLRRTEAFLKKYVGDPLIVPAVAPHALYTNNEETLRAARLLADKYTVPLVMHLSETRKENDDVQAMYQASPTKVLERWGILNGRSVMAHGVWLSPEDIGVLKSRRAGVAHCPSSNMKLASGLAPVPDLLRAGVSVGLGPDGPAGSNNDFDLFEEMDMAAKLHKVHTNDPTTLPADVVFGMATMGGAQVLGLEKEIGSIEAGKRADLILISTAEPHAVPMFNVYSHLVYSLKSSDVRHVMVNGRLVVRDRKLLTLDTAAILAKARKWGDQIRAASSK